MEKNVEIALLFSFYKRMLTEKQANTIELYYNRDMSLSEVGDELGISRQGVRDNLKRAEAVLYDTEGRLGLAERFLRIKKRLSEVDEIIARIEALPEAVTLSAQIKTHINKILSIVKQISDDEQ